MKKLISAVALSVTMPMICFAESTVEELRIEKARKVIPSVVDRWEKDLNGFKRMWSSQTSSYAGAKALAETIGDYLWTESKANMQDFDDRPLYWARLQAAEIFRIINPNFALSEKQRLELVEILENSSRGRHDLEYLTDAPLKILITGFDPFLLDRNIEQGNPSGIAALLLDDQVIEYQGRRAEINSVIFPVRFEDFDRGEVETLLAPFYALNSVDMVVTISQGRSDFDLERFPGRRRSSQAPDNLNKYIEGDKARPVISNVGRYGLQGPEFVEFSLPVKAMQQAKGKYQINDNHGVETLEKGEFDARTLNELAGSTAVQGGGGGYLSNEISYRSIRLRNMLGSQIPTGHIHTPVLKKASPEQARPIFEQIKAMLERALPTL
ncbi:hypothetical protein QSV34_04345 [Porticoccus sp. W117]|uniref:hypothetical protein n=1 Tax=Porticoccus sp. W117 TaxID=3054777 RepID=UPI002591ED8E|nr:hypothetical protein [Porticoccus sp. W117]MDM3870579.1 hypothetical protein [Porticoccus sp. W117]